MTTIERIRAFNDARGWAKYHTPKNLGLAIASEAGELCHALRWLSPDHTFAIVDMDRVLDELGDVMIFASIFADRLGWSVDAIIDRKISINEDNHPARPDAPHSKEMR